MPLARTLLVCTLLHGLAAWLGLGPALAPETCLTLTALPGSALPGFALSGSALLRLAVAVGWSPASDSTCLAALVGADMWLPIPLGSSCHCSLTVFEGG